MNIKLRMTRRLDEEMRADLSREHAFAFERVGFVSTRYSRLENGNILVILVQYLAIDDEDYLMDKNVGARINGSAIRQAMQHILDFGDGILHVHQHLFDGIPDLSDTDKEEIPPLVRNFDNLGKDVANGILLISKTGYNAYLSIPAQSGLVKTRNVSVVGFPLFVNI